VDDSTMQQFKSAEHILLDCDELPRMNGTREQDRWLHRLIDLQKQVVLDLQVLSFGWFILGLLLPIIFTFFIFPSSINRHDVYRPVLPRCSDLVKGYNVWKIGLNTLYKSFHI
jgi:hypothetical protein